MEKLKLLEQLEYSFGKRVMLDTPLRMVSVTKQVDPVDSFDPSIGVVMHQRLILETNCRMAAEYANEELDHRNRIACRMFAEELYGEVARDLFTILRHTHEHHSDPELGQMINALMQKLRP